MFPRLPKVFFDRIVYGFWMMFNEPFEVFKPLYLGPEDPSVASKYQIELKVKSGDAYLYFTPIDQKSKLEPMVVGIDKGSGLPGWIRVGKNSAWQPDKIYRFQKYMPIRGKEADEVWSGDTIRESFMERPSPASPQAKSQPKSGLS